MGNYDHLIRMMRAEGLSFADAAADAIETLAAERDALVRDLASIKAHETDLTNQAEALAAENARLRLERDHANDCADAAIAGQHAAEAESARLREALREIRELNMTGADENGHRWANSDLIEQEIVFSGALLAPTAVDDGALKGNDHE